MSRAQTAPMLAAVVRSIREEKGVTQEALAFKAEVSISTLSHIERGVTRGPAWLTIQAIADALDVTMVEIAAAVESGDERLHARAASVDGAGRRETRPKGLMPTVARLVLACAPLTVEMATDAERIAQEAEVEPSTARRCLDALVTAGDVLLVPGQPVRFYVSGQGEGRMRQEVEEARLGVAVREGVAA